MKIVELPHWWTRPADKQAEMDAIIAELRRKNPPKPKPVRPEGMSEEEFILSLQAPSCARVLKMNEEELAAHKARPMISMEDAAANKDAFEAYKKDPSPENWKKMVGARDLTPDDIAAYERMRRTSKNTLGQSTESATTDGGRASAVDAFIFTPPAKVTKAEVEARAVNLIEYKSEPLREEWVELSWWQAMVHRLKGNKIRVEPKK